MNDLVKKFQDKLIVLGFPCNQFGHQENCSEKEIPNILKYVRPGNGYEAQFPLFSKVAVNGKNAHPVFQYLKECLPFPTDNTTNLMDDPKSIIWSPVKRNDISWNFEKFLIDQHGVPFKRYSPRFQTKDIDDDIKRLLKA